MNEEQKRELMKDVDFKCQKCKYYSPLGKGLEINKANKTVLCSICNHHAPEQESDFKEYIGEEIDWRVLDSFRKFGKNSKDNLKKAMIEVAKQGRIVSRPAFGYKIEKGILIPAENSDEVREIFEAFLAGSSLNKISQLHNMSVNGIKKVLKNFTYVGKVKFDSQILNGNHSPIITSELFNSVQQKFEGK